MSWTWERRPAPASLEDQGAPRDALCMAGPADRDEVALFLKGNGPLPEVRVENFPVQVDLYEDRARVVFHLPPAQSFDEEWFLRVDGDVETIQLHIRRSHCKIHESAGQIGPQLRSALLWYGWARFREIFVIRRINTGMTAEVLVIQPFLVKPVVPQELDCDGLDLLESARAGFLLVKNGPLEKLQEEWQRILTFLPSWANPYLAHSHLFLPSLLAGTTEPTPAHASLIGFFLGGGSFRSTTLEVALRETADVERRERLLSRVFETLRPWHQLGQLRPLGEWSAMLRRKGEGWLLFGRYDFSLPEHCALFQRNIGGSPRMGSVEHLQGHILGKLIPRLAELRVNFSLTHGDLHPRNVLVDRENAWLIDFGNTSVGPSYFDYTRMEVFLRRWWFRLPTLSSRLMKHFGILEDSLLQRMITGESDGSVLYELAEGIGVDSEQLVRMVETILWLRRRADVEQSDPYPDRRGYLAVLYLTLLKKMSYAHLKSEACDVVNYQWLYHAIWQVEDRLCAILEIPPFPRGSTTWNDSQLISRRWIVPKGSPGRLEYLLRSPESPLAAVNVTRGVMQSERHHLDLYGEILFSLALCEELLESPEVWVEPAHVARQALAKLRGQGIDLPDPVLELPRSRAQLPSGQWFARLNQSDNLEVLKWTLLFQSLGKLLTRRFNRAQGQLVFDGYAALASHMLEHQFDGLLGETCTSCGGRTELVEDRWVCGLRHSFQRCPEDLLARVQKQVSRREELERQVLERSPAGLDEVSAAQIYCSLLAAQGQGSTELLSRLADSVLERMHG